MYKPGDEVSIFSTAFNASGTPVSANVDFYIYKPDDTLLASGSSTQLIAGFFKATSTLATNISAGTYQVKIYSQFGGAEAHDTLAFIVERPALSIHNNVGAVYILGETVEVFSTAMESNGALVPADVSVYVYDPSNTLVYSASSTELSTIGFFKTSTTLSTASSTGTYREQIDASYAGNEAHDVLAFTAVPSIAGLPLNVFNNVGARYVPGEEVALFSTVSSASGTHVSANVDYYIYRPDDTLLTSGLSTQLSSGFFKATTTLATDAATGTYRVKLDAQFGGNEVHDNLAFTVFGNVGFTLNMFNDVGTRYNLGDEVAVYSTIFDSLGSPVNANIDFYIYRQ